MSGINESYEKLYLAANKDITKRDKQILRLIEEVKSLQEEKGKLRMRWPILSDELLGHIEAEIIVRTGDGPLAAYVVRWLGSKLLK